MNAPGAGKTGRLEKMLIRYARLFPIDRGKLRIVNLLWRKAVGTGDAQRTATLEYGGFTIRCDLNDQLQRQFYFFGTYFLEKELLECWSVAARTAGIIFDVGANAGIFSLAALASRPKAVVHAFEPTPEIAEGLRSTAAANGLDTLHVHEAAVSDKNGTGVLVRCRGSDNSNSGMNFVVGGDESRGTRIPTVSLDEFCDQRGIGHIDLLKIDIQGNEHLALQGAQRLLAAGRISVIFAELNWAPPGEQFCGATETLKLLSTAGYRFSTPGKRPRWREAENWLKDVSNVVAARSPRTA